MSRRLCYLIGSGLFALVLTGCVTRFDPDTMQPRAEVEAPPVYGAHTVGQTFVAAQPRLCGIELVCQPPAIVSGTVVLHLRSDPASTTDLARFESRTGRPPARWRFSPIPDSQGHEFYLLIEAPQATAERPLRLRAAPRDVYTPGSATADDLPWTGDLSFRTFYDYDLWMLLGDLVTGLRKVWLFLPMLALFWAPGFVLLQCWPAARRRFDGWEQAALALGLSLAAIPFMLLWVTQLGSALRVPTARVLFGGFGVAAIVIGGIRLRHHRVALTREEAGRAILVALVLGVGLAARLLAVRDLALPAWVDSVHHTVVARIITESGRVPTSYEPYIAVSEATYHYGFQASVAAFTWLSGQALPQAVLLVGQIFNLTAALQVYLLARWLTRRQWAAFFAALIVALVSSMPAYYVSWGRYTQLSGLLILPVASILNIEAAGRRDLRAAALGVLALAGLVITHYRVFAFYVCFVAAWWLVELANRPRAWRARLCELGWTAATGLLALTSLLPWILRVAADLWLRPFAYPGGAPAGAYWDFSWRYVTSGFDRYLLMTGVLGALVALARRQRFSTVLLLWAGFLLIVTNPSLLGLPGEGLINNVTMLITWFVPVAVWCGFLGDEIFNRWLASLKKRWRALCAGLAAVALTVLSAAGIRRQITIVNPDCVLALRADREALAWIEGHTPPDSHFLINARPWQDATYVGTDGGYWITPLTGRLTTTPPALYALGESEDVLRIQQFNQRIEALAADPAELWAFLRDEGVDYVYVGALGGLLDADALRANPGFRPVYTEERVRILEVVER